MVNSLSDDQIDVLKEVFNLGMGSALKSLSQITGENNEILFEIPTIELVSLNDFLKNKIIDKQNVMVVQYYKGDISGESIMFFKNSKNCQLAQYLIDSNLPAEEVSILESDAFMEVGNIFINGAVRCLSNFLNLKVSTGLPRLKTFEEYVKLKGEDDVSIYLESYFQLKHLKVDGYISFFISNDTIEKLKNKIDSSIGSPL